MSLSKKELTDINNENLDQLIQKERSYNIIQLKDKVFQNISLLNKDQRTAYNAIIFAVKYVFKCFFIDRSNKTDKTFLYNTLFISIKSYR